MNIQRLCGVLVLSILLLAGPLTGQADELFPADFDDDGDIDLADFADFQTCALGPGVFQGDTVCTGALLDADDDVDFDDFEVFHACLGGADNPADLSCACASGETNCDGTCVNTASDYANCGTCGHACATGLVCQSGSCVPCGGGLTPCSGFCASLTIDPSNCGACGNQCPENEPNCIGGVCQTGWRGAGLIPGDFDDDGDLDLADFADFQTCFLGPAIAQTNPECTDARLDSDEDVDLDDFEVFQGCLGGADNPADPNCACPSGQTDCGGACRDLMWDGWNCGACGNICQPVDHCSWGSCEGSCPGCEP